MTVELGTRLTTSEVARLLGVSRRTILKAERDGRIPPAEREHGGDDRLYTSEQVEQLRDYFFRDRFGSDSTN